MNSSEFTDFMNEDQNMGKLVFESEQHFLKLNPRIVEDRSTSGLSSNHPLFLSFQHFNDQNIPKIIQRFDPESYSDELSAERLRDIFIYAYYPRFLPQVISNAVKMARRQQSVSMYSKSERGEILADIIPAVEQVEDVYIRKDEYAFLMKLNKNFIRTLQGITERIVFKGMQEGATDKVIAERVWPDQAITNADVQKAQYVRGLLEYRYLCFQVLSGYYAEETFLKAFKNYRAKNKKFFGVEVLTELPSKEDLERVVEAKRSPRTAQPTTPLPTLAVANVDDLLKAVMIYDPKAERIPAVSNPDRPVYRSRLAFNGQVHKTFVVYVNRFGFAYDHTTKTTRNLMRKDVV